MTGGPAPEAEASYGWADLSVTAAELARRHELGPGAPRPLPVLASAQRLTTFVAEAREHFVAATERSGRTKAGEWFLDNDYSVLRSIRRMREDMPAGFYARLPALRSTGEPRIHALARALVLATDLQPDQAAIALFVAAYQEVAPLRMSELWALPTMLRLTAVAELVRAVGIQMGLRTAPVELPEYEPTRSALNGAERVSRTILTLRALSQIDWKEVFRSLSVVEATLARDPARFYARMDFETGDRYRKVVEEIAWQAGEEEPVVAERAVELAREAGGADERAAHVGHFLLGAGREQLERAFGYRPRRAERARRWARRHATPVYLTAIALSTLACWSLPIAYLVASGASTAMLALGALLSLIPASTLGTTVVQWVLTQTLPPRVLPKLDLSDGIPESCRTIVVVPTLLGSAEEVQMLLRQVEMHQLSNPDPTLRFAILADYLDAPEEHVTGDAELLRRAVDGIRSLNRKHGGDGREPFHLLVRGRRWNPGEGCWMGWERKRGKLEELDRLLRGARDTSFETHVGARKDLEGVRFVITLDSDTMLPRDAAARLVGTLAHPLNRARLDPDTGRVLSGYTVVQPRVEISPRSGERSLFTHYYAGDTGVDIYTRAVSDVYQDLFGAGVYVGKGIYDVDAFQQSLAGRCPENRLVSHDLFEGIHGRVGLTTDVVLYEEYPPHYLAFARRMHRWVRGDWQLLPWLLPRVPAAGGGQVRNRFAAIDLWKIFDNHRRSLFAVSTFALLAAGWLVLPGHAWAWTLLATLAPAGHIFTGLVSGLARGRRRPALRPVLIGVLQSTRENLGRWFLSLAFLPYEAWTTGDAIARTLYRLAVSRKHFLEWRTAAHTVHLIASRGPHSLVWSEMGVAPALGLLLAIALVVLHPANLLFAWPLLALWLASPELAHLISLPPRRRVEQPTPKEVRELRKLARRTWLFFEAFVGPQEQWLPPDNFQEVPGGIVAHRASPTNVGMMLLSTLSAHDLGYLTTTELALRLRDSFESLERMEHYRGHLFNWYDTHGLEPLEPRYVSTVDSGNLAGCLLALQQGCLEAATGPVLRARQWDGLADTLGLLHDTLRGVADPASYAVWGALSTRLQALIRETEDAREQPSRWGELLLELDDRSVPELSRTMAEALRVHGAALDLSTLRSLRDWTEQVRQHLRSMRQEVDLLVPWLLRTSRVPDLLEEAPPVSDLAEAWTRMRELLRPDVALEELPELCRRFPEQLADLRARLRSSGADERALRDALSWVDELETSARGVDTNARELHGDLVSIGARAQAEAAGIDFGLLYDPQLHLFHIGFDASTNKLDPSHYDLLASEARLASYLAIAKGDVPVEHWFHLGRSATRIARRLVLLSWGGTMFEYLMPALLMRADDKTFLGRSCRVAVEGQIAYGAKLGLPWGVSESGYHALDPAGNYQYRAFGVPGLGFKRGLGEDRVVTPYASLLGLRYRPRAVVENVRRLAELDMVGEYGLYEALDFTPEHVPGGRRCAVVRSYMAHHQGMIMVALGNQLCADAMVRRFHADSTVQSAAILLYEQIPSGLPPETPRPDVAHEVHLAVAPGIPKRPWSPAVAGPAPEVHVLSNGSLSCLFTDSGGGWLRFEDTALTRWRGDSVRDDSGTWIYLRDEDSGAVWSIGRNPVGVVPNEELVLFHPHMIELHRRDHGLFARLEVAVAPDEDAEIRRLVLVNETAEPRTITVTTCAEVALCETREEGRHPAFDKLFVESEHVPALDALLFRRRPRSEDGARGVLVHRLVRGGPGVRLASHETRRERFLGRGGSPRRPAALHEGRASAVEPDEPVEPDEARGDGRTGLVLDPVLSLTVEVELGPSQAEELAFVTAVGEHRSAALEIAERFGSMESVAIRMHDAEVTCDRELALAGVDPGDLPALQKVLSALVLPSWFHRAGARTVARNTLGKPRLWGHAISGDLPVLLLHQVDLEDTELLQLLVRGQRFWRGRGVTVDLVVLWRGPASYEDDSRGRLTRVVEECGAGDWVHRSGGIFIVHGEQIPEEERVLLESVARVVLRSDRGPLARQWAEAPGPAHDLPLFLGSGRVDDDRPYELELERPADLLFDNGLGGFDPETADYVVHLEPGVQTPAPWCNVLANDRLGCLVTESGPGTTWGENSGEMRLTPWRNDPVDGEPAEALYLRDEESAVLWSPTPGPAPDGRAYQVRHGAGFTEWLHSSQGLTQRTRVFVDASEPIKVIRLQLENRTPRTRRLTVTYYAEWVLGSMPEESQLMIVPEFARDLGALLATCDWNPDFAGRVAFLGSTGRPHALTGTRREFLGRNGTLARPQALTRWGLSGIVEAGRDPCAALQLHLDLEPGASVELAFLLGQGRDRAHAERLLREFSDPERIRASQDALESHWRGLLGSLRVETPEPAMDLLLNRWLLYQAIAARLQGRTALYQSSGAFGFRDQLQDVLALLGVWPERARAHLLAAAGRQFAEGDVLHWWHPPHGRGVRTRCSDDLLWLPYVTAAYVEATGDEAILDELVPFLTGEPLRPHEHDRYGDFEPGADPRDLLEHCRRALERGSTVGRHGLPLMGDGDWNDGMNRIGDEGRGESVWLGWFVVATARAFAGLCERRGLGEEAARWRERADHLARTVDEVAWDGSWYLRAFDDEGTRIGSKESTECRIDSIAQSWSVLSGGGAPTRARRALASAEEQLVLPDERLVLLLRPPFDRGPVDPGYIAGYPPGVRENGGQYSHAAVWLAWAFAELGEGAKAEELFRLLSPVLHATTPEEVRRYRVEPYVIAADVYGVEPHLGRGGWTWYTGAAAWAWRLGVEAILGLRWSAGDLRLDPRIPGAWPGFRATVVRGDLTLAIEVENAGGAGRGVTRLELDGRPLAGDRIPLAGLRGEHRAVARLGAPSASAAGTTTRA